jgi:hypothetical protein
MQPRELWDGFIPIDCLIRHDNVVNAVKDTAHSDPFKLQRVDDQDFDTFYIAGTAVICWYVKTCSHGTSFRPP